MTNKIYSISMRTPIGMRYGKITVYKADDVLSGTLALLNHCKPFSGTIDDDGNCEFCGTIISLVRAIPYRAVGKIDDNSVELILQGGNNKFRITGKAIAESEATV